MAESHRDLVRRGLISPKAMNATLAKTRAQKTKMVDFDTKQKNEGSGKTRGAQSVNHINAAMGQAKGSVGRVSAKGGIGKPESQVSSRAIDESTGKPWPVGSTGSAKKNPGVRGGVVKSAPSDYGGPSSRKYG